MDDKIYVAFTGFARSGKDSFCSEFQKQVEDFCPNLKVDIVSFANHIRQEVGVFVQEQFGISAWTEENSEKEIIRHFLRGYGMSRRSSDNLYFVKALEKQIQTVYASSNVIIVSDLRFAQFEQDELSWLKSKRNNLHIHICRYKKDSFDAPVRKQQEFLVWNKEYHMVDGVKTLSPQPDPTKPYPGTPR